MRIALTKKQINKIAMGRNLRDSRGKSIRFSKQIRHRIAELRRLGFINKLNVELNFSDMVVEITMKCA